MNWIDALILGIIQGLTEFLPVSSSGHLEIGKVLLGVEIKENINRYLFFTTDISNAVEGTDVIFLCLNTPPKRDGSSDLSYYLNAAHHLAAYLERRIDITYNLALIISAMAIFIGILVAFHLAGILLQKMVNITPLGHVDRLGGGLFGLLKGTLLVSLILVIILNLPFPSEFREDLEKDPVVRVIYPVMPMLFDFVLSRTPEHLSFDKIVRSADYSLEDAKEKADEMEKKIEKNIKKGIKKVQASSGKP